MDLEIRYGNRTNLTQEEIDQINSFSKHYGTVTIKKRGSRSGAIDLITILEYTFYTTLVKTAIGGYLKGFVNEEYYKEIGKEHREKIKKEITDFKNYLIAFYNVFLVNKKREEYAISMVEYIEGVVCYAVLNHERATENLISKLPDAFVQVIGEISLQRVPIEEPKTVQLYPNFENETWDYLFIPTINKFGDFINRYFDLTTRTVVEIATREEFYEKFKIFGEQDIYKFIISAKYHEKRKSDIK